MIYFGGWVCGVILAISLIASPYLLWKGEKLLSVVFAIPVLTLVLIIVGVFARELWGEIAYKWTDEGNGVKSGTPRWFNKW